MIHNYQFLRFRQLRSHQTHLGVAGNGEDVAVSGPNSPPTAVRRALFFPTVVSSWDPLAANPPAPGWWESAQVTQSFTWDPDSSGLFSRNEMGEADPPAVSLGFVKLYPHVYTRGVANAQYSCVWTPDQNTIEFETGRRTDVLPSPTVHATIWTFDSFGVFQNAGGTIAVSHSLTNYGAILWDNPT